MFQHIIKNFIPRIPHKTLLVFFLAIILFFSTVPLPAAAVSIVDIENPVAKKLPVKLSGIFGNLKFELDFRMDGGCLSTGPWSSISIRPPGANKGNGQVYFGNIVYFPPNIPLKGPFVADRRAVMDWINNASQGKRERVDMILTFLNKHERDLVFFELMDVLPISYQPPTVSSGNFDMLEESLTFSPLRIRPEKDAVCQSNSNESNTNGGNDSDKILFGGKFVVSIEDVEESVTSFSGGGVRFNPREYTIAKVNWANIVLEKNYVKGDRKWEEWFQKKTAKEIALEYLDAEGNPARGVNFFNATPVRYDVVNVDSRAGSSSIKEVMVLKVERAEYR